MNLNCGDIRIDQIIEMELPYRAPLELFIGATEDDVERHRAWLEPWGLCPETGGVIIAVQSYLLRTSRHTILVDTCVGCGKNNPWFEPWHLRTDDGWLSKLAAVGVVPEQVDFVMCSHLHSDHVGWNTRLVDGRWVPTFPNAKYIMTQKDLDYAAANADDKYHESVLPVIDAGQAVGVEVDHALDDEVWLEPSLGHTPGHVCICTSSKGAEAVMSGDLIHSPLQLKYPEWGFSADSDPDLAAKTRHAFLEAHCDRDRLVMTAHFPSPSVGHVTRDGSNFGFRFLDVEGSGKPREV